MWRLQFIGEGPPEDRKANKFYLSNTVGNPEERGLVCVLNLPGKAGNSETGR